MKILIGDFILKGEITDDGNLAQKMAEILVRELHEFGVNEVEVDFDLASEN